jgi:two-component system OmpR family sensor kinase
VRLDLAAAGRAGGELARRLDLLLCHSGLRLDRQRLDLLALARAALEGAARAAPDRTFVLETGWRRLPLVGDAGRLASVLENLLDNASRATEPGQKITVRVGLEGAIAARSVFLEVEDPGCGIPAAQRAAVFEPGVSFLPGGFGLGLTLCRQIVRMHGGRLDLSSCPGRTVFRAVVPQIGRAGALGGASSAVNEEKTGHAA